MLDQVDFKGQVIYEYKWTRYLGPVWLIAFSLLSYYVVPRYFAVGNYSWFIYIILILFGIAGFLQIFLMNRDIRIDDVGIEIRRMLLKDIQIEFSRLTKVDVNILDDSGDFSGVKILLSRPAEEYYIDLEYLKSKEEFVVELKKKVIN